MKVKNISAKLIILKSKEGKDKLIPLQEVEILKANEAYAQKLIKAGELKEVKAPKLTKEVKADTI